MPRLPDPAIRLEPASVPAEPVRPGTGFPDTDSPHPSLTEDRDRLAEVTAVFHALFAGQDAESGGAAGTRLAGGHPEPFYRAPGAEGGAEIRFTRDYLNSCLHEAAHWCIAGRARRGLNDYGYWYRPDGRDASGQREFFAAEAAPQALEWAFALACGAGFRPSLDNLGGEAEGGAEFALVLEEKLRGYLAAGFPARADAFLRGLMARFHPEVAEGDLVPWLLARMRPPSACSPTDP